MPNRSVCTPNDHSVNKNGQNSPPLQVNEQEQNEKFGKAAYLKPA
jgi:hypothetical protein